MTFKNILMLGLVEAAAGIVIQEGLKVAREKGLFEKAKDKLLELTETTEFLPIESNQ